MIKIMIFKRGYPDPQNVFNGEKHGYKQFCGINKRMDGMRNMKGLDNNKGNR